MNWLLSTADADDYRIFCKTAEQSYLSDLIWVNRITLTSSRLQSNSSSFNWFLAFFIGKQMVSFVIYAILSGKAELSEFFLPTLDRRISRYEPLLIESGRIFSSEFLRIILPYLDWYGMEWILLVHERARRLVGKKSSKEGYVGNFQIGLNRVLPFIGSICFVKNHRYYRPRMNCPLVCSTCDFEQNQFSQWKYNLTSF